MLLSQVWSNQNYANKMSCASNLKRQKFTNPKSLRFVFKISSSSNPKRQKMPSPNRENLIFITFNKPTTLAYYIITHNLCGNES